MIYRNFNKNDYMFKSILKDMFSINNLELIHEILKLKYEKFEVDTDQDTEIHKTFYKHMKENFTSEYKRFIRKEIFPAYSEAILFQKFPTFRVSLPDNVAVGGFHKDSDYNHSALEVNYFLPFQQLAK